MAVITVYPNGVKAGIAPSPSDHQRAKRKECSGWSDKSARSNLEFLRSVVIDDLTGLGHAFTLTVRTCPESPEVWAAIRKRYFERLKYAGVVRIHWVTEWQRRGVPHLHGVAFFECPLDGHDYARQDMLLRRAWLEAVQDRMTEQSGQHIKPMEKTLGWLQYLAKHASRGAAHYQRSRETMPKQWDGVTGRMWGKVGKWPVQEGMRLELPDAAFFAFRRYMRGWRLADARFVSGKLSERQERARRLRIVSARAMLKCGFETLAAVRGVSEWIPEAVQYRMVQYLGMYHEVRC